MMMPIQQGWDRLMLRSRVTIFGMMPHIRCVQPALAARRPAPLALFIAGLQYTQVQTAFPPDQVMVEFQTRIARELGHGLLLFLPQVGIVAGLLAWQILRLRNGQRQPIIFGTVTGALLAIVEAIIMLLMAENWFYIVGLAFLLICAGGFAGWFASPNESTLT